MSCIFYLSVSPFRRHRAVQVVCLHHISEMSLKVLSLCSILTSVYLTPADSLILYVSTETCHLLFGCHYAFFLELACVWSRLFLLWVCLVCGIWLWSNLGLFPDLLHISPHPVMSSGIRTASRRLSITFIHQRSILPSIGPLVQRVRALASSTDLAAIHGLRPNRRVPTSLLCLRGLKFCITPTMFKTAPAQTYPSQSLRVPTFISPVTSIILCTRPLWLPIGLSKHVYVLAIAARSRSSTISYALHLDFLLWNISGVSIGTPLQQ